MVDGAVRPGVRHQHQPGAQGPADPRRGTPELDEAAIVAAYQRHHSVSYLANALGKEDRVIKAVLAAHGVDIQRPPRPSLSRKLPADT